MRENNPAPRITITYVRDANGCCAPPGWGRSLCRPSGRTSGEVAPVPGTGGVFEIRYDGATIWKRNANGGFPEAEILKHRARPA